MWRAEITVHPDSRFFSRWKLKRVGAVKQSKNHYTVDADSKKKIDRLCDRYRLSVKWYKKQWTRSSGYRSAFFRNNKPPYRCRYCHRRLPKDKLEVDHLMPVGKAKRHAHIRFLLWVSGIRDINDPKNLVASCHSCNERKRDKTGWWYIRGVLGKYKLYWLVVYLFRLALFLGLIWLSYQVFLYIIWT